MQGTPHPGAVAALRSSSGTPTRGSQLKSQSSWSSEALSRRLESDFSHASHSVGVDGGVTKAGQPWPNTNGHHTNGHAHANGNTNGGVVPPLANGHSRGGGAAQHQQHGKQAGEAIQSDISQNSYRLTSNARFLQEYPNLGIP